MSESKPDAISIYSRAVERPDGPERAAFLDEACSEQPALRAEVEELLIGLARVKAVPKLDPVTSDHPHGPNSEALADRESATGRAGDIIAGRYKLVEEIGEGGMGLVWMALQIEPVKRPVAVKLIKAGMDSKAVLARFDAERQALALMDHPNIARVLDAGATETGHPFFVMELMKGAPITKFCDERRLAPRERLELFVQVCQAVQHAHQKGIIHRDIKPSNVLVALYDDRPVPKVIDFGVAKATGQPLTDESLVTGFGAVVGTPEYMSPEQAGFNNLDIDTRADVYSLGVLLYELLSGSPPFSRKELDRIGLLEIFRVIREVEPPRPSTKLSTADALPTLAANRSTEPARLTRLLRTELDWVAMKALEKDRARRYDTANALAADVQRYLAGEAVQAVPPSVGYRLRKFVRRHKGRVVAAGVLVLALMGAVGGAVYGVAERQNQREANALRLQAENARDRTELALGDAERARGGEKQARVEAERGREVLAHFEYGWAMQVAHQEWRDNNVAAMRALLDATDPRLRNWEWRYLDRLCDPSLATVTFRGQPGALEAAAFSPDGTRVVTAGRDNIARVWDAQTGAELLTFTGHSRKKGSLGGMLAVFSPDGTRVATRGEDDTVKVWDARTGDEVVTFRGHKSVGAMAFSPDGARVVSGGDTVKVWDAKTGNEILTLGPHERGVGAVAFSPDGTRVVTGAGDGMAKLWDARTGAEVLTLIAGVKRVWSAEFGVWVLPNPQIAPDAVQAASFSPDGTRVLTLSDVRVRVWDTKTGAEVLVLKSPTIGWQASFSPDGSRIVTGGNPAKVWDARTGAEVVALTGHTGSAITASFSPDGTRVLTGGSEGTAKVWDARMGPEVVTLVKDHGESALAFSPDGARIVTGSWNGMAKLWDARTGAQVLILQPHADVRAAAFSVDGTRVVTVSNRDHTAKVWDVTTGAELLTIKVPTEVQAVALSPDGTRLVTGGKDGTASVWDARTGAEVLVLKGHTGWVWAVTFSPDGALVVTGGKDKVARVWDAKTGTEILVLKGHTELVNAVAFSADGTRVLTGGWDKVARVWDAKTGAEILLLKGHTEVVRTVALSPDGARILTGSDDATAKVWDAKTGTQVLTLKPDHGIYSAAFSADGTRVLTLGEGWGVAVWDSRPFRDSRPADPARAVARQPRAK